MVTAIYKIGLEIWGLPPTKKWRPKNSQFWRDFGYRRNLIANISGLEQAIISRKTVLQTTDTPIHVYT